MGLLLLPPSLPPSSFPPSGPYRGRSRCLISVRPGGRGTHNNQQPATDPGHLYQQRGALGSPAWPPRPGPSAASWGASCSTGAAPPLAPACPACGSPTEVPAVHALFKGASVGARDPVTSPGQGCPARRWAVSSARRRDSVTPTQPVGRTSRSFPEMVIQLPPEAGPGRRAGAGPRRVEEGEAEMQGDNLRGLLRKGEKRGGPERPQ